MKRFFQDWGVLVLFILSGLMLGMSNWILTKAAKLERSAYKVLRHSKEVQHYNDSIMELLIKILI